MDTNETDSCVFLGSGKRSIEGTSLAMAPEHLLALVWHFCEQEELKFCCLGDMYVVYAVMRQSA